MPQTVDLTQRRRWPRTPLQRYRAELVLLRQTGASYRQLTQWLAHRRVHVADTTVRRYLQSLPELNDAEL